jgi:hypothetical protein
MKINEKYFLLNRRIDNSNTNDPTQNGSNQEVLKIEVFHGRYFSP